jgi:hypothetical protein
MPAIPLAEKTVTRAYEDADASGESLQDLVARGHSRDKNIARRIVAALMRRTFMTSYCDPLFLRPDLIEDDYYRFRNQPASR